MIKMKLSDIIISPSFSKSVPRKEKMETCRRNWEKYQKQDRYIVVNKKGLLIDGYIQYLVLMEHKEEYAEVKISNCKRNSWHRKELSELKIPKYKNNPTTYVFGVHPNCDCAKEYVWRVPEGWTNFIENIQVEDIVFGKTKFGYSPVVITKIETLDKPPIDVPIKKIFNTKIKRNGVLVNSVRKDKR